MKEDKKEDNKKKVTKTILAGAGTVAGAAIGGMVENAVHAEVGDLTASEPQVIEAEPSADIPEETVQAVEASPAEAEVVVAAQPAVHTATPNRPTEEAHIEATVEATTAEEPALEPEAIEAEAQEEEDADEDIIIVTQGEETIETDEETDPSDAMEAEAEEAIEAEADEAIEAEVIQPEVVNAEVVTAEETDTIVDASPATDTNEAPNYLEEQDVEKTEGLSASLTGIETPDMPDYINNANIDSFTDPS